MDAKSQRPKGRDSAASSLSMAITTLNLANEAASITPANGAFGAVGILLGTIRVRFLQLCGCVLPVHICLGFNE